MSRKGSKISFRIHRHAELGSTNTEAMRLAADGAPEGTVVIAETQTGGRGRRGRLWVSPPGKNLYMSVVLRAETRPETAWIYTFLGAVAVAQTVTGFGAEAGLKWPNDVFLDGKKLAGVLVESSFRGGAIRHLVVGMGINLNDDLGSLPEGVRGMATSLKKHLGREVDRDGFTMSLLDALAEGFEKIRAEGTGAILETFRGLTVTLGREVEVSLVDGSKLRGKAVDLDRVGGLVVEEVPGGRIRTVSLAEVSV